MTPGHVDLYRITHVQLVQDVPMVLRYAVPLVVGAPDYAAALGEYSAAVGSDPAQELHYIVGITSDGEVVDQVLVASRAAPDVEWTTNVPTSTAWALRALWIGGDR